MKWRTRVGGLILLFGGAMTSHAQHEPDPRRVAVARQVVAALEAKGVPMRVTVPVIGDSIPGADRTRVVTQALLDKYLPPARVRELRVQWLVEEFSEAELLGVLEYASSGTESAVSRKFTSAQVSLGRKLVNALNAVLAEHHDELRQMIEAQFLLPPA